MLMFKRCIVGNGVLNGLNDHIMYIYIKLLLVVIVIIIKITIMQHYL